MVSANTTFVAPGPDPAPFVPPAAYASHTASPAPFVGPAPPWDTAAETHTTSFEVGATGRCATVPNTGPGTTGGRFVPGVNPDTFIPSENSLPPSVVMNSDIRSLPPNSTFVGRSGSAIRSSSLPPASNTSTPSPHTYTFPDASTVTPSPCTCANTTRLESDPSPLIA